MTKHKESFVSAHHNYLVNSVLAPGFVLGEPNTQEEFYFVADVVLPGADTARISARLFDSGGLLLLELNQNRIEKNPGGCNYESALDGFRIRYPSGEPLLEVHTQKFANGYLTHIQGKLYDGHGGLRMSPAHDENFLQAEATTVLKAPFKLQTARK